MKRHGTLLQFFLALGLIFSSNTSFAKFVFGKINTMDGVHHAFYEKKKDYYLSEFDILVEPAVAGHKNEKATTRHFGKWEGGVVPYEIDGSIPDMARLTEAIQYFNDNTPIKMVARTNEHDFVYFKNNGSDDCSSFVGKKGGKQTINIPDWCGKGSIIHEVMHALGHYHEQSRPDRWKWIKVKWSNIELKRWPNFFASPFARKFGDFDFDSIMLYPSYNGFAKDPNKPTITTKDGGTFGANRQALSVQDLEALVARYPEK